MLQTNVAVVAGLYDPIQDDVILNSILTHQALTVVVAVLVLQPASTISTIKLPVLAQVVNVLLDILVPLGAVFIE
jgi:hypothetical protein